MTLPKPTRHLSASELFQTGFAANNPGVVPKETQPPNLRRFSFQPKPVGFSGKRGKEAGDRGAASEIPEIKELPFISPNPQ